jgi:integrase
VASIEKRTRNGRVTYRVPAGRQRSKVFVRKVDADRWMAENEAAKVRGAWVDPAAGRERFGEWAERWFGTTAALRPSTRHDYRTLLDRQVLPVFAGARLADLDALAVREWLAGLVGGGLSAKRARKAHQVLAQVLDAAVDGGRLARNVAAGVKLPKVQRREMHFLNAVQVEQLADAIDLRFGTLVRFAAYTGLRPCELVALRVGRLDLLRGTVRVAQAAPEVAGRLEWGGVKTHEARTVRLPRFLCDELGATRRPAARPRRLGVHRAAGRPATRVEVRPRLLQACRSRRRPAAHPAVLRPEAHGRESAHPRGCQRQGGAEATRPRDRQHHPGHLRPSVPGRAGRARRAP